MNVRVLIIVSLLFSCKSKITENIGPKQLPNIIFILVDDLGKEWISCYGAQDIETPHIDALAKSGMLFNHVYSMPQCTPTRLTLLTGQYPFRHGWVNHWDVPRWGGGAHYDETRNPSLGIELKKAGYKTCIAGKWQIDDFRVEPDALTNNGFDAYCMWTGYETGVPASAERYDNPYLFSDGKSSTHHDAFGPDVFKNFILDFIHKNKDEAMFIYYPMVLTHTPFINTPDESGSDNLSKHKAMVRYTDKITGEIVAAIKDADLLSNTLFIWTTDNGTSGQISTNYLDEVIKGGKSKTSEAGICEPFIASWPGTIPAGKTSDALIDFTDIYPTFLDLAGIKPPSTVRIGKEDQPIDGKSFKNVLTNETDHSNRKWIMSMGGGNHAKLTDRGVENQFRYRDRVLRNQRYKLHINAHAEPAAFYDLEKDPLERNNLMENLTETEKYNFDALYSVVSSFPKQDSDPRYVPNPPQEWDVDITAESDVWKK